MKVCVKFCNASALPKLTRQALGGKTQWLMCAKPSSAVQDDAGQAGYPSAESLTTTKILKQSMLKIS